LLEGRALEFFPRKLARRPDRDHKDAMASKFGGVEASRNQWVMQQNLARHKSIIGGFKPRQPKPRVAPAKPAPTPDTESPSSDSESKSKSKTPAP